MPWYDITRLLYEVIITRYVVVIIRFGPLTAVCLSLLIGYTCKNRNLSNSKTISPFILDCFIAYILYKCCLYCQWSRTKCHHLDYSLRFRQLYSATDLAILFSYCFIQICKNWYSSSLYLNNNSIVYIR